MNKLLFVSALALTLAAPLTAPADDAVRGAQVSLRNAGFYTGAVDGELNADTKAALRRYQLRNQLEPTGELTPETATALAKEPPAGGSPAPAASEAAPAPAAPAAVPQPAPAASETAPAPAVPAAVPQPAPAVAPEPVPARAVDPAFLVLFARTPYQNASPEVQARVVRDAQALLARLGLYRGPLDGVPGPGFHRALARYQAERRLAPSEQLDIDTLAAMHLLPVAKVARPRTAPVPYEAPVPGRIPRGVPLD